MGFRSEDTWKRRETKGVLNGACTEHESRESGYTVTHLKLGASAGLDILRSESFPYFYENQAFCLVYIKHSLETQKGKIRVRHLHLRSLGGLPFDQSELKIKKKAVIMDMHPNVLMGTPRESSLVISLSTFG